MSNRPSAPAPNWFPDPYGVEELRYWDGAQWTEWVAPVGGEARQVAPSPPPPKATASVDSPAEHHTVVETAAISPEAAKVEAPARSVQDSVVGAGRVSLIEKAVEEWKRQLVDLTGFNRLVYFRESKKGSLSLDDAEPSSLEFLLGGKAIKLSKLFGSGAASVDSASFDVAVKAMRSIDRTALVNAEEQGIETLFVTSCWMSWDAAGSSKATPNAPIVMAPLQARSTGGSKSDFVLERTDAWEVNETLLLFWEEQFGVVLDRAELSAMVEDNQSDPSFIAQHVHSLASQAGVLKALTVRQGSALSNFKYTKMPMVKDLESSVNELAQSDLIAAIAGDQDAALALRSDNAPGEVDERLPNFIAPDQEFLVLDADSSQSYVVNAVASGRSLVVEGPPGTGKSQTISNVIATLAAEGKSVLFVAEKRAALEAVQTRLEQVGLAEITLDLHGITLKKKDLAASLGASLSSVTESVLPRVGGLHAELSQFRQQAVSYEEELHRVHAPWEVSYFDVLQELGGLADAPLEPLSDVVIDEMSDDRRLEIERSFAELRSVEAAAGLSSRWNTVVIESEAVAEDLVASVQRYRDYLIADVRSAVAAAEADVPSMSRMTIRQLEDFVLIHRSLVDVERNLWPGVWELDLPETHRVLKSKRPLLPGTAEYRAVKKAIASASTNKFRRAAVVSSLERAIEVEQHWGDLLGGGPIRLPVAIEIERSLGELLAQMPTLENIEPLSRDLPLREIEQLVGELAGSEREALLLGQASEIRAQLRTGGFGQLLSDIDAGFIAEDLTDQVLRRSISEGVKRRIEKRARNLMSFEGSEHTHAVGRYSHADSEHIRTAAERVSRGVSERTLRILNEYPQQASIIEKEAKKKTRHLSLRKLQDQAGDVLTSLKPCWMMSPLMVAQVLPARPCFDYVIFDEASQIRPADAVSSLLRGRNVVVAGDRRQLPPSNFFDGSGSGEIDEYDEDAPDALTSGYESLLDVVSVTLPGRMLNWHYRSNDDRLIALSNDHIYEGGLTTFPGSQQESPIRFHKVDHVPADKTEVASNPTEVRRIVDLMLEHARERSEMSLGVIAFGQKHATAIEDQLASTITSTSDPELEAYFNEDRPERVFVKNIERVQGDERDAIILAIGYGHDVNGKVPLRFGPVNQDGGERRINVAASRARSRMDVVASISSSELHVDNLSKGPRLLRDLIRFAETGGEDTGAMAIKHPLNSFELAVQYELQLLGLDPICQYGFAGYRIDFALPHPSNNGQMVLAVEADGASYHSSLTARDRDRLRQQVLEAKGWRFHRIWSTAFFRDPKSEALKVKEAYESALRGDPAQPIAPFHAGTTPSPPTMPSTKPRLIPGLPITEYKHRELVALAKWATNNGERLLTDEQIHDAMKSELGFKRSGSRINEAFDRAIRDAGVGTR